MGQFKKKRYEINQFDASGVKVGFIRVHETKAEADKHAKQLKAQPLTARQSGHTFKVQSVDAKE